MGQFGGNIILTGVMKNVYRIFLRHKYLLKTLRPLRFAEDVLILKYSDNGRTLDK